MHELTEVENMEGKQGTGREEKKREKRGGVGGQRSGGTSFAVKTLRA